MVLAAQRAAYEELRDQIRAEVRRLCGDPGLVARLTEEIRRLLGPDAEITELPGGGVLGRSSGLVADLSAETLADRALELIGKEVTQLWEPRSRG
jgi:hypothetical protein